MRSALRQALFAAIAVVTLGCGPVGPSMVVDGWPVGEPFECRMADGECVFYVPLATTALDHRDPGHAPIVNFALYQQAAYRQEDGDFRVPMCSGGCFIIVLFQLGDGSVKAIGAGTIGVSREVTTRDYGPLSS
jgi:hypothetical protein